MMIVFLNQKLTAIYFYIKSQFCNYKTSTMWYSNKTWTMTIPGDMPMLMGEISQGPTLDEELQTI